MVAIYVSVDQATAKLWLETYPFEATKTRIAMRDDYVETMLDGGWRPYSGDYVRFQDGVLVDGWCRVSAVAVSGVTCTLLVDGRTPEPPLRPGRVHRDRSGRIVCDFCGGHRVLQHRDVVLQHEGEEVWASFVVCEGCLQTFGVPHSSSEWFDRNKWGWSTKKQERLHKALEREDAERGVPRYQPGGDLQPCSKCSGKVRIFETINDKPYAMHESLLYTEEIPAENRWTWVQSLRRVMWLPGAPAGLTLYFPHFLVCGAGRAAPEGLALRALFFRNGGRRPVGLEESEHLFDWMERPGRDDGTQTPRF